MACSDGGRGMHNRMLGAFRAPAHGCRDKPGRCVAAAAGRGVWAGRRGVGLGEAAVIETGWAAADRRVRSDGAQNVRHYISRPSRIWRGGLELASGAYAREHNAGLVPPTSTSLLRELPAGAPFGRGGEWTVGRKPKAPQESETYRQGRSRHASDDSALVDLRTRSPGPCRPASQIRRELPAECRTSRHARGCVHTPGEPLTLGRAKERPGQDPQGAVRPATARARLLRRRRLARVWKACPTRPERTPGDGRSSERSAGRAQSG